MAYYSFDSFKRVYVHTNYHSFESNRGSFGGYGLALAALADETIRKQEEREAAINQALSEITGIGDLQGIVDFINNWFKDYEKPIEEQVWVKGMGEKYGKIMSVAHAAENLEKEAQEVQNIFNKITEGMDGLIEKGGFNKDTINKSIANLKELTKGYKVPFEGSGIEAAVRGSVLNLKGHVYEFVMLKVLAATNAYIAAGSQGQIKYVGGEKGKGGQRGADIMMQIGNVSFGFSIKSTRQTEKQQTFSTYGAYIFHGSIESVAAAMGAYTGHWDAIQAFKYYLVNISRMRAKSLTGQKSQASIRTISEGYNLVKGLLRAYSTIFIGENDPAVPEEYRQVDIFVLHGLVYLKSDLLKHLIEERDIDAFLKIGYSKGDKNWDEFDSLKRNIMFDTLGSKQVVNRLALDLILI